MAIRFVVVLFFFFCFLRASWAVSAGPTVDFSFCVLWTSEASGLVVLSGMA